MDNLLELLTFLIALGVAYIAYHQYRLERAKFKLDMFEKRFVVFNATRKLLRAMVKDGPGELEAIYVFRFETADATFLFCRDITDYLEEIDNKAVDYWNITKRLRSPSNESQRNSCIEREAEAITWFSGQLVKINEKFLPYLDLRTWR